MVVGYDRPTKTYYVKEKIENQTFFMEFQNYDETDDTIYYNICMGIYNKRKHAGRNENEGRMTGLNPFRTIKVATEAFELLEKEVVNSKRSKRKYISCGWVDNRRRDAYYKFLSKRGYRYGNDGYKQIFKVYDKGVTLPV